MQTLSPYEVINSHILRLKNNINTNFVAEVTKVNTVGDYIESVNVRPVVNKVYVRDGLSTPRAEVYNVPVVFPSAGGGILSFPIQIGDTVVVVCSQEDIDKWKEDGVKGNPNTARRLSLTDAIALPSIYPRGKNLKPPKDHTELKFKNGSIKINDDSIVEITTESDVVINTQGSLQTTAANEINLTSRRDTNITADKIAIGNSEVEIVDYLSRLTQAISEIQTVDSKPLKPDKIAAFTALKAEIDELKK